MSGKPLKTFLVKSWVKMMTLIQIKRHHLLQHRVPNHNLNLLQLNKPTKRTMRIRKKKKTRKRRKIKRRKIPMRPKKKSEAKNKEKDGESSSDSPSSSGNDNSGGEASSSSNEKSGGGGFGTARISVLATRKHHRIGPAKGPPAKAPTKAMSYL